MSHADIQALYILHYFSYIVGEEEDIAVFHNVKELFSVVPSLPSRAGSKTGLGTG